MTNLFGLRSRSELIAIAAFVVLGAACSPAHGPDAPSSGSASPVTHTLTWKQEPGTEIVQCHTFKLGTDIPLDVERIKFDFGAGSHHVHIYKSNDPDADGVRDCTSGLQWPRWLLVVGAQTEPLDWKLPDGLTLPLKANQQLLVQVHWLNTTPAPIDGKIDISFYPAPHAGQPVGVVFGVNKQVQMQPNQRKRVSHFCPMPAGSQVIAMMGHFHVLGREYETRLRGADQPFEEGRQIYHGLDENTLTFEGFSPPVAVGENQGLDFQCDFANTRDFPITWGPDTAHQEHCNMAAYYYPAPPDANGFCIKDPDDVGSLAGIRASAPRIGVGGLTELTIETAAPVEADTDITLVSSDPTALAVPAGVRIPAHGRSVTVTARGMRPSSGVRVTAGLGAQTTAMWVGVDGLLLSELLVRPNPYDAEAGRGPWVEIANTTGQPIDLSRYKLAVRDLQQGGAPSGATGMPLAGTLQPHGCMVVMASTAPPLAMDGDTPTLEAPAGMLPSGEDGPVVVDLVDVDGTSSPIAGSGGDQPLDSVTYGNPSGGGDGRLGSSLLRLSPDRWSETMVPTPGICEIRP